jgi:drug/metabolite transporter (DMT)-like permease
MSNCSGIILPGAPLVMAEDWSVFQRIPNFTARTWVGLALLTFFHNFLSMVPFLKAFKQLDALQAELSNYLITFFGIPTAVIWLGERLAPLALIGGIIILGSTLLITVWDKQGASNEVKAAEPSALDWLTCLLSRSGPPAEV